MSASGGISLDLTVVVFFFFAFWNSLSLDVPHLTSLAKRYMYKTSTAFILLMLRGSSPSIILYFQTEEGGAAKKKLKALVFLYYNSFISYEYLV